MKIFWLSLDDDHDLFKFQKIRKVIHWECSQKVTSKRGDGVFGELTDPIDSLFSHQCGLNNYHSKEQETLN
jgi:hypothetical protein